MEEQSLFHNRYFLESLLGRGNFSEVWLAKDKKTDIQVALKIYAPATGLDDAGLNLFAREFSLVVNANHKNLLKPLYYDNYDRKPYLVLPYCSKGSIMKDVGNFDEESAWKVIRDVASGLAFLHSMNPPVIHQDIKPDNIMVSENGDYTITDFGISTHLKSTLRKSLSSAFTSAGTIAYMAPERFGKDKTPIMANDIYSLGATVFELLTGDTPFGDDGGLVQMKGAEVPELPGNYSVELKKVINKCLKTNPWERPTAEQLESYANQHLEGRTIRFLDEKTFFQKFRIQIIASIVALILVIVAGGIWFNKHQRDVEIERNRLLQIERLEQQNKDLSDRIVKKVDEASTLKTKGDAHEEYYERYYIDAYKCYLESDKLLLQMSNEELKNSINYSNEKSVLENVLRESYSSFCQTAEFLENAGETEQAKEFRQRADAISAIIDISNKK